MHSARRRRVRSELVLIDAKEEQKSPVTTGDNLFSHDIFRGFGVALYVFCDQSQKMTAAPPPPQGPGPPKWRQN